MKTGMFLNENDAIITHENIQSSDYIGAECHECVG
jgi:hypothetical protein